MSPDYGSRLQLQKIVMLDVADMVVVNKSDLAGRGRRSVEIGQRTGSNCHRAADRLRVAKRHRDAGVDELFSILTERQPDADSPDVARLEHNGLEVMLDSVVKAVEAFNRSVDREVEARGPTPTSAISSCRSGAAIRAAIGQTTTPTGLTLPRLALPQVDEPGEIARHLLGEGLPGEFPFVNAAYPQMYLAQLTQRQRQRRQGRRADASVRRPGSGRGHQRPLPLPHRPPAQRPPQHRLRRPDALRPRQRRRRRARQGRRGRRRDRHRRRHGAPLRRLHRSATTTSPSR